MPRMTWRMRFACWVTKATDTYSEYMILFALSTATVLTRTYFSVTLYVHCHSCLLVVLKLRMT